VRPALRGWLRDADALRPLLEARSAWISSVVENSGRGGVVLALSGGIDSALALVLATRGLGPDRVTAVHLPSRHTDLVHLDDARAAAGAAGLPFDRLRTVSIEPLVQGVMATRVEAGDTDLRLGNASARCRMIVVFDLAAELGALVLGTENRTENLLGYFTRFGDAASDLEPLSDLYKTEVRIAAGLLALPESIIAKDPTAGLWAGQTDEAELGFSYREADLALSALHDGGLDVARAAEQTGVPPGVVQRVAARVAEVAWKHEVPYMPPTA
jgi:NAD+ synthase